MKPLYILSVSLLSLSLSVSAQDDRRPVNPAGTTPPPAVGRGASAIPERYGMPGPMHRMLELQEGVWNETAMLYSAPGAKPVTIEQQVFNMMTMEGLFLQSTHIAMVNGRPFKAISTTGFDNTRNIFMNTWMDNMSSGMVYSEGTFDPKKNLITYTGQMQTAGSNRPIPFRQEVVFTDKDNMVVRTYMTGIGAVEYMSMEAKMTRDNSMMPPDIQDPRQRHMIMEQIMQKRAAAGRQGNNR